MEDVQATSVTPTLSFAVPLITIVSFVVVDMLFDGLVIVNVGAVVSAPPLQDGPRAAVHLYKLLGTHIRIRYETRDQETWIHPSLAHLETAHATPDVTMDVVSGPQGHNVYRDGTPVYASAALDQLTPSIKSWVWIIAVNRHGYFLDIHAGVVSDGTGVTLLPGVAGSGKSSLTAALSRSGFDCLSDEVALLEEPAMTVRPVRLALCVKSTGWDLIEPYFPELRSVKTHRRGDGKIVRYVPPPAFTHGTRLDQTYPVRRIIFPRYVPGSQTQLTPIRRVDALRRLLEDCLAMPVPLTPLRVEQLATWIKSVDCAELIESSLTEAVALVRAVGQVEVIFTLAFGRYYLREPLARSELAGLLTVGVGVVLALAGSF